MNRIDSQLDLWDSTCLNLFDEMEMETCPTEDIPLFLADSSTTTENDSLLWIQNVDDGIVYDYEGDGELMPSLSESHDLLHFRPDSPLVF